MSAEGLTLTIHFGESDRVDGRLLSDALMDVLAGHEARAAVLLRGVEGFGISHRLRTDRLLTLSEDLPLVVVAADTRARIEAIVPAVTALLRGGLVTLERTVLADVQLDDDLTAGAGDVKLTVYCGRSEERDGRPVVWSAVRMLREAGIPGTIVLAGLDGTMLGERRRARFFSRNEDVPALIVGVGSRTLLADVLPRLRTLMPGRHVMTLERVHALRREGRALADLPSVPARDAGGLALWQRVSVLAGEAERWQGHPLHSRLIRRLREDGAAGATVLRGLTGYSGGGPIHADRLLTVRRRTPVVVTMIDGVDEVARLWPVIADATASAGQVTCEVVPAFRALGPQGDVGGLRLADPTAPP